MIQVNTATKRGLSLLFPGSLVSPAQTRTKATTEAAIIAGKGRVFQESQETCVIQTFGTCKKKAAVQGAAAIVWETSMKKPSHTRLGGYVCEKY